MPRVNKKNCRFADQKIDILSFLKAYVRIIINNKYWDVF